MDTWLILVIAMLFAKFGIAIVYYFGIIWPIQWLEKKIPPSKWKEILFKQRYSLFPFRGGCGAGLIERTKD